MATFIKDSKNIKEKLQDIMPWEVLLLNKLYNSPTQIFNSLAPAFKLEIVDFVQLQPSLLKIFADLSREIYSSYLKTSFISPLVDSFYSVSDQVIKSSPEFLDQNISKLMPENVTLDEDSKYNFLTTSLQAEIIQIEVAEKLEGKILVPGNDIKTLMNLCNILGKPDFHHASFNFIRLLDTIKSADQHHFLTKNLQYIDVLVLSALGHCRSWTRIFKDSQHTSKVLPNILKWAEYMKVEYKEFLDFQVHHSILSKRHLKETAKKHILKSYHSDFIQAVRRGQYDQVRKLLQSGVSVESIDPEDKNKPALHLACQNGDMEMVKILERYGCDFEARDYEHLTPIFYAISSENLDLIKYVLSKGVNIEHKDNQDRTPFYWACCQCSKTVVDFLHEKGCNVNSLSKLNRSPLTKAAYLGRADIVELLLSYKETIVDLPGNKGRTALHNAVWGKAGGREGKRVGSTQQEDSPAAAQLLLERGANVNLKDSDGNTSLAIAAASHADRSISILIAFGADLNAPNKAGESPLYQASKWGHLEVCKLLMENYSPDPFIKSDIGYDSFEVAIVAGHFELALYFLDKLKRRVIEDDAYFESVVKHTAKSFTEEVRLNFLIELFKVRPDAPVHFLSEDIIRIFTKLKDEKIIKVLQDYLRRWTIKRGLEGNEKVHVMVEEAMKMHWVGCCRILYSEYSLEISKLHLEIGDLEGLGALKNEDLFFLLENFNLNIFMPDRKGETLLHVFVGQRNINGLLELLNLLTDVTKGKKVVGNKYMNGLEINFIKDAVKSKNKEGYSALDFALINKYYEIHGVLTKFLGEDLEGSIRLAKYKIVVNKKEEPVEHVLKDMLIAQVKKLKELTRETSKEPAEKDEDEKQEENKIEENKVEDNKKENSKVEHNKVIVPPEELPIPWYNVHKREIDYLEAVLLIKKDKGIDKTEGKSKNKNKSKKKRPEEANHQQEAEGELVVNDREAPKGLENEISQRVVSFVDNEETLAQVAQEISEYSLIGVDTEYYIEDRGEKVGFICLMQISTIKQDYIIDCIKLHQIVPKYLAPIFISEKHVKVFHGCESDLKWLKADFNIDVVNLFDTSRALMLINNVDLPYSLTYLASAYLGFALDKSYQKADWRVRPLPKGMMEYARRDSCVLLYLWYILDGEFKYKCPEKIAKMAKNMAVKCWKILEKSTRPTIQVISLD